MFKEKYTQDNENIRLPDETKAYMLYKLNQRANASVQKASAGRGMHRLVAAALSLAIAVGCGALVATHTPAAPQIQQVQNATDYQELYALNKKILTASLQHDYVLLDDVINVLTGGAARDDAFVSDQEAPGATIDENITYTETEDGAIDPEYSVTNTQHIDVDEADVVKTDGKYIYTLAQNAGRVSILKADGADTKVVSTIALPQKEQTEGGVRQTNIESMYVVGDRLVLIVTQMYRNKGYYGAVIYDITHRDNPQKVKSLLQSGAAETTRVVDGVLYIISRYYVNQKMQQDAPETYVPTLLDDTTPGLCPAEDIALLPQPKAAQYTVVGAVDIATASRIDQQSVFGATSGVYANTKNIYATSASVENDRRVTNVVRFAINRGQITLAATGQVPGTPLNQFSMDEHAGVFRMVTTSQTVKSSADGNYVFGVGETANGVYLLDQDLQMLGKIEDLAPGERVYSVRFMGDIGYFVTFRETDPLFSVDLSDPTAPKILGELKIPGFSNYLHPYDEGLLGLGMDADENGVTGGVKLSMFATSDPTDVTEAHTLVLDARYSDALYDHKAVLVDVEKNIIGFATEEDYVVYGYDPTEGFTLRATLTQCYGARGLYIDDVFYLCTREWVQMYTLNTFAPLGRVDLN